MKKESPLGELEKKLAKLSQWFMRSNKEILISPDGEKRRRLENGAERNTLGQLGEEIDTCRNIVQALAAAESTKTGPADMKSVPREEVRAVLETFAEVATGQEDVPLPDLPVIESMDGLGQQVKETLRRMRETDHLLQEYALGLCQNFDVLHRFSMGDRAARVRSTSRIELLTAFNEMTNRMLDSIADEMQGRKAAVDATHRREKTIQALLNATTDIIILVDTSGRILALNEQASKRFGKTAEELLGHCSLDFFNEEVARKRREIGEKAIHAKRPIRFEDERDGRFLDNNVYPVLDDAGNVIQLAIYVRDITEQKIAEKKTLEMETRFQTLSDATFEAIVIHKDGILLDANNQFFHMFGYEREELVGKRVIPMTIAPHSVPIVEQQIAAGKVGRYEITGMRKDGTLFPVESRGRLINYDGHEVRIGVMRDVTKEKSIERELVMHREKLRSLASQLSLAEEEQRRLIASEVHDHIGQNLAFAKMKLGGLKGSIASEEGRQTLGEIFTLIDTTIQDTRRLVSEIGSPVLYELGFVPAVQWLCHQTEETHGVSVLFWDDKKQKSLSRDIQVLLFQSVRELLANVVKHARAKAVQVYVLRIDNEIRVIVGDDGIGFEKVEIGVGSEKGRGYGLFSIQERLEPLGCRLQIDSEKNGGTIAVLSGPLTETTTK